MVLDVFSGGSLYQQYHSWRVKVKVEFHSVSFFNAHSFRWAPLPQNLLSTPPYTWGMNSIRMTYGCQRIIFVFVCASSESRDINNDKTEMKIKMEMNRDLDTRQLSEMSGH